MIKDKVTTVRFTSLQAKRLRVLADRRQWSISKMIQFIIDFYCNAVFVDGTDYLKE